jgi:hypothetical protein
MCSFIGVMMCYVLYGQNKPPVTVPKALREVSGVVKDSTDTGIEGVTVRLVSLKDTLQTLTNGQGVFVFKNVKLAEFIISIGGLGYLNSSRKYLNNDTKARLVLKPIVLKSEHQLLNEVEIKGKTGPKYLKDTVEFWADDHIIRDYAKLEDLLRKMEGVSVDKAGNVMHQGQEVKRAKFNGINYFGGDIKSAIKELPANIVERIQIIDDYGDQAAATGVKSGESTKVLNVVSKADKSVGTMYDLTGESNLNDRHYASGSFKRIDGFKQIGVDISDGQIPAGINNSPPVGTISRSKPAYLGFNGSGSSIEGGQIKDLDGGLNYSDQLNEHLTFESSYRFKKSSSSAFSNSVSEEYYSAGLVRGNRSSMGNSHSQNHSFRGVVNYNPAKSDQFVITTNLDYNDNKSSSDQRFLQTGAINIKQQSVNGSEAKIPAYNASVLYTHFFKPIGSSLSFQFSSSAKKVNEDRDDENMFDNIVPEMGSAEPRLHYLRDISRLGRNQALQAVYSLPIRKFLKMNLVAGVSYSDNNSSQVVNVLDDYGRAREIDSLSRKFSYQTIDNPFSLKFAYNRNTWYELNFGVKVVGSHLRGSYGVLKNVIQRDSYTVIPELDFRLSPSKRAEFKLGYTAAIQQPAFVQVLPIPDISDPLNIQMGNTALKTAVLHRPSLSFITFSTEAKLQLDVRVSGVFTNNKVVSNQILIKDPDFGVRRETHYVNANGDYSLMGYYNVSKSFENVHYAIKINGMANYFNSVSMNDGLKNIGKTWGLTQQAVFETTPVHWLDVNPGIKFIFNRTAFSLPGFSGIHSGITEFNVYGKAYLSKVFVFGFDAGKSLVRGFNDTHNPFIVNLNLERRIFKQKNGIVSVVLMDALKQNNFFSRTLMSNGFVDSHSNPDSRYFLLQFSWSPQHWSAGSNAGKARARNGMFIK